MRRDWEGQLERWTAARLIDADTAGRIRTWENAQPPAQRWNWPVWIALAFGVILLAAGVLLFVSAQWNELSPAGRMSLLVAAIAVLHGCGAAVASRFEALAVALHTTGSIALGGAIAVAGQIFNLSEHWPAAILLWAIGCACAWLLLRHWTQAALCAVLFPWWLAGEWATRVPAPDEFAMLPLWAGICALSLMYLGARHSADDSPLRKALVWLGGVAVLPAAALVSVPAARRGTVDVTDYLLAWAVAMLVPLLVGLILNRRQWVWIVAAIAWVGVLAAISSSAHVSVVSYLWCAIGAAGMAAWGIRDARAERVNLGVAGLALTALVFYFSTVMDKLGRSASLAVVGLLFLGGGWLLEHMRRRMLAHMSKEAL